MISEEEDLAQPIPRWDQLTEREQAELINLACTFGEAVHEDNQPPLGPGLLSQRMAHSIALEMYTSARRILNKREKAKDDAGSSRST